MAGIKLSNINYSYNNIKVFNNLNFYLRKNKSLSIIGPSGSGKTTLLKLLNNDLEFDGEITCDDTISVVFKDANFLCETVKEELINILENKKIKKKDIQNRLKQIDLFFDLKKIFNKNINELSTNDKTLVKILSYAISKPTYIAIDDLFIDLNMRTKILLLNYLNSNDIILINVTSNMEDILYTDYLLCLYNGISAIDGKTLDVLKNEKLLKRLGFSLPFIIDLSIQLEAYGLINKIYLNKEDLVKNLWK